MPVVLTGICLLKSISHGLMYLLHLGKRKYKIREEKQKVHEENFNEFYTFKSTARLMSIVQENGHYTFLPRKWSDVFNTNTKSKKSNKDKMK